MIFAGQEQLFSQADKPIRLGLLGGTFDPVHFGHLLLAEQAYQQFDLDAVLFVPTGQPVRKLETVLSSTGDRYEMLVIATSSNPHFFVSRIEMDRPGITYTIDTVRAMKAVWGDEVELFFITGIDATYDLGTWKEASSLASMVTVLSANRGGVDEENLVKTHVEVGFKVLTFTIPALEISSQHIRASLESGGSVRYLLPEAVLEYITNRGLYVSEVKEEHLRRYSR
ncbi:MAG: nicotinate-nucleotide adenylyltransferase [Coriobacteriaceae bacterium]|nr:nicotinate-nucleotide adenylyltransferase [Coriobacteriaceae bacterium]